MITKFKVFESYSSWDFDKGPKVGDYVYCHINEDEDFEQIKTDNFLRNNFGKVISINPERESGASYAIEFKTRLENRFDNQLSKGFEEFSNVVFFYPEEVILWSDTEEELELKIEAKKYNL